VSSEEEAPEIDLDQVEWVDGYDPEGRNDPYSDEEYEVEEAMAENFAQARAHPQFGVKRGGGRTKPFSQDIQR
jgi:hypothetical protein